MIWKMSKRKYSDLTNQNHIILSNFPTVKEKNSSTKKVLGYRSDVWHLMRFLVYDSVSVGSRWVLDDTNHGVPNEVNGKWRMNFMANCVPMVLK